MASSSTNKQPLLIDRPLLVVESLAASSAPTGSLDVGSGVNGVLLVDCTQNDGALLSEVAAISRVANVGFNIALYLSRSALSLGVNAAGGGFGAHGFALIEVPANAAFGVWTPAELPRLLGPVPRAGTSTVPGRPPQYRGLPIAKGWALWAAVLKTAPDPNAPNIACVGGFY